MCHQIWDLSCLDSIDLPDTEPYAGDDNRDDDDDDDDDDEADISFV